MKLTFDAISTYSPRYKALYAAFCADSCWKNRLALAALEDKMLDEGFIEDDINELQDEVLEEQAMEAEVA